MRTYQQSKAMAKSLRKSLAARQIELTYGECLEIVAQQFGFANSNILASKLGVESKSVDRDTGPVSLQAPIPLIRVNSMLEAKALYVDFFGFVFD